MSEDLYFKGMYDKQVDKKNEKEKTLVCAKCGSKNIEKVTAVEPVFVNVAIIYKCLDCDHQGKVKIIES